jgi:hypothetical protein
MKNLKILYLSLCFLAGLATFPSFAQQKITTPKEQFGFNIGDDYQLVNYTQMVEYWKKLEQESGRIKLVEIGRTAEGRTIMMAIITSPENHENLLRYKGIARQLALAEGLADGEARKLAREGRAVVWIDGGLHATEILGSQQLIQLVFEMASRNDKETLRILDDVILLAVCSNPDGLELVAGWYNREPDLKKRTTRGIPRLYQKYIGHDNNRDFYMVTQPETEAICRVFYHDWFPQIIYNQHQTGPAGCVLFAPPFQPHFNYNFDPLVVTEIELVGAAMHTRFVAENKPGATMRSGAGYSVWWNGGLRTTSYFHNMVGILTETIGNPTPIKIPFLPPKQLPHNDLPFPVAPQDWHFRQSVEYSLTADRAVLDVASKNREDFLYNIYRMGMNSIERGSRDHWTIHPDMITAVEDQIKRDGVKLKGPARFEGYPLKYYEMLHDPQKRDPRGYIIPSDQRDFLTATKFVNALIKNGITVLRATQPFEVEGHSYPQGSYVVRTAQAFRPHILDMFEPQDYPEDIPCPDGPPNPLYDSAGWTLAYQMGVMFDRILEGFEGPFERIEGLAKPPSGKVVERKGTSGYLLSHKENDAFLAINRLLGKGKEVYWLKKSFQMDGKLYPCGTIYIPQKSVSINELKDMAEEIGLNFEACVMEPEGDAFSLRPVKIGLWDQYGGSMASGWVRWLLEKFEFPFEVVFPQTLDAGKLREKYDVLIFASGAIPRSDSERPGGYRFFYQPKPEDVPSGYRHCLGKVTVSKTVPQLKNFLQQGGTILAIGSSTCLEYHLDLPVVDALVERQKDGKEKPLPREKYYVTGSLLRAKVDNTHPLAYGMADEVDVFFRFSPVFRLLPEASLEGVKTAAWFGKGSLIRSGWAWGEHYLNGGVLVVEAGVGKGKLFLYGPEITFRAQPHGTFKFLFNGIFYGGAEIREF